MVEAWGLGLRELQSTLLSGGSIGGFILGTIVKVIKRDTRSLDHTPYP